MAFTDERLVHLDFKGAPIKIDYLEKVFTFFREWGATGLLIEWEDTFPYSGRLASIGSQKSSTLAYTQGEIQRIHSLAQDNKLSVIPLLQTFGHLEFVLKHPEWQNLREVLRYPSSVCPSHTSTLPLIKEMLDQVIKLSPDIQYIHIGSDEVWHLGLCESCSKRPKPEIFLSHVVAVLQYLRHQYPQIVPIMWDDMLRCIDEKVLCEYGIGNLVEPMVWHYHPAGSFSLPDDLWVKYSRVFPNIWAASAFKGATGSCQILPITIHHVSNHERWLAVLKTNRERFKAVRGIALTGWSRYDHYATLCELLPTALPSLALCLRVWLTENFTHEVLKTVSTNLGYTEFPLPLNPYPRPQIIAQELNFPGWRVSVGIEWLANVRVKHMSIVESDQVKTWLNPWQIRMNFTNPMQIESLARTFKELDMEWDSLEQYLQQHLLDVYYEATINEFIGSIIQPLREQLKSIIKDAHSQLALS